MSLLAGELMNLVQGMVVKVICNGSLLGEIAAGGREILAT
jgi:hypothetical protein